MSRETIYSELLTGLLDRYGPLISGPELAKVLGYPTSAAFRQAIRRGQISLPIFEIPYRQQKFALSIDVAHWLVEQRAPQFNEKRREINVID